IAARVRVFAGGTGDLDTPIILGNMLNPFGMNYTGGVNVASGDINHDGKDEILVATATGGSNVKGFRLNGSTYALALGRISAFAGTVGAQITTLDINGDGVSEFAVATQNPRGDLLVKLYNNNGAEIAGYKAATQVDAYGLASSDLDQDGNEELMVGIIPAPGTVAIAGNDQVNVLDPLNGQKESGFDVISVLVSGISLDSI
ncbi:MAG TPA: VCBS repeat-containing protein, partial [Gemmata sp.]|nr:VCBS repeat-containing protein [Gemmata sp.]